ncbi:pre-mRNA-splicing factor syf2, partial [Lineolata rhizophorae]
AAASSQNERMARFKALQARQVAARKSNLKESTAETQRASVDQSQLVSVTRKHANASQKLLKADAAAAGEDFERKRAWDWTVDEAEAWDRRQAKRAAHRADVAFQDYSQMARKVYKRQLRQLGEADLEGYQRQKAAALERAAKKEGLQIVETEDELVAVDDTFNGLPETMDFAKHRPEKEKVDRLISEMRKAEEVKLKKRRDRGKGEDDSDVTYINEKNKQFNDKLRRFYDKYTKDIRDSFERGTAL